MRKNRLIQKMTSLTTVIGVTSVVFAALLNPGQYTAEVNLHDGGVWVTNSSLNLVGHLNYRARTLDSAMRTSSSEFDVVQNGESVHLVDAENDTFAPIDVATSSIVHPVSFPDLNVNAGGRTVALSDRGTGRVWTQSLTSATEFSPDDVTPVIDNVPNAVTLVGADGAVHAVSPQTKKLVSVPAGRDSSSAIVRELPQLGEKANLALTAVGSTPVVFDHARSTLYLPNGEQRVLEPSTYALQEPGPESDSVILADTTRLLSVPLAGGEITFSHKHESPGNPVRPVVHQGCAYGAWTGAGSFSRDCLKDEADSHSLVDSLSGVQEARFRTNRDVIVLNDIKSGSLWLPDHNMILIQDWDQVHSQVENEEESEEDSVDTTKETILPERAEENTVPIAENDEFGVRPGRTNILPVILNDSDPDGDFLTASPVTQPEGAEVSIARYGAALQVKLNDGVTGTLSFDYEVNDGRGGVARATVKLIVRENSENHAPVQMVVPSVDLGTASTATFNALANWYDPDGDPFYLESAVAPQGISVRQRETGTIDMTEAGHGPGKAVVELSVSDGRDVGKGEITLNVSGENNVPPVANVDHLVVRQGETAIARVLDNDTDANGDPLRIVQVSSPPFGISLDWDGNEGTLTIGGERLGTYYLTYIVSDGPSTATGIVRVDVIDGSSDLRISAEDDFGVLPTGGYVLVDLLANDSDPAGGILAVQKIDLPATSPLSVALLNHHVVRISAPHSLDGPQTFDYTVSNGTSFAVATVTVIPRPADEAPEGPQAAPDHLVVRVGDVGSVAVLDNDRSPAGLKLSVVPVLDHNVPPEMATVFLSDNVVRVRGGNTPGAADIHYTVVDSFGQFHTSVVHLIVRDTDEGDNTAPKPRDIIVRALAGSTTSIKIPLDGIDPEGDSVTIEGLASSPRLGTARLEGTTIHYEASPDAIGTDTFSYSVRDRLGLAAVGRIRVGIVQRSPLNQNPVALPDLVRVRPGAKVAVDVLGNDTDPDGDTVRLVDGSVSSPTADLINPKIHSGRIVLKAPQQESRHTVLYGIADGVGGKAEGVLTLLVTPDAPLLVPIARDDTVTIEQVQAAEGSTVTIPVLLNDEDPDGLIDDVELASNDRNLRVNSDRTVTVTVTDKEQLLIYSITDADKLTASAVVRVPGLTYERPTLDTRPRTLEVKAGETIDISINDYVVTREGRSVRLTSEDKVRAGIGANGERLVKSPTTLTFTSLPDFAGMTSISFEVTDGIDINDSEGATAFITLPIRVIGKQNRPPTIRPVPLRVGAGEDPITVDLAPTVSDPDGESPTTFTYNLADIPTGINAQLSGSTLTLSTGIEQRKGPIGTLTVTVTDGQGASASGQFPITVLATSLPPIQISPAQIVLEGDASEQIDIAEYAVNPMPEKGPLSLIGQPQASEGGVATASGTRITVKAAPNYFGKFVVTYRVGDATKDPSREATGTISVSVQSVPEAPRNLRAEAAASNAVRLTWETGDTRGLPITHFVVTDHTQGDTIDCGVVTTCVLQNRRPGQEHVFSVVAHNKVGPSDPSAQVSIKLDVVPEAPAQPSVKAGDREVTVTWSPPRNEGSAIQSYEVTLSPHGSQTIQVSPGHGPQTAVFSGLTNGIEYVATVTATNAQGTSVASPASVKATPYGRPSPVEGLEATYANLGAAAPSDKPVISVSWRPSSNNGRAVEYYTVRSGDIVKTVDAPAVSTTIELPGFPTQQVSFTVTATNNRSKPDESTSTAASVSIWVYGRPAPPKILSLAPTGRDNELRLSWERSPGGAGWKPDELNYEWNNGQNWLPYTEDVLKSHSWTNGTAQTVSLRAVGTRNGQAVASETVTSNSATPYGPPQAPNISCRGGDKHVYCKWQGGNENGRSGTYRLLGHATREVAAQGEQNFPVEPSTPVRLCIEFTQRDSVNQAVHNCASATSDAPPPPPPPEPEPEPEPPGPTPDPPGGGNPPGGENPPGGANPPGDGNLAFNLSVRWPYARLTYSGDNLPSGQYKIYCWNAASEDQANWGESFHNPGNFLGMAPHPRFPSHPLLVQFSGLGGFNFYCPGNPYQYQAPNENFSVQLYSIDGQPHIWVH
ncbi:Ig-like domain-containing protein [Schaalia canis]|uniref:Fibronectin type III domain-containing protein n=1 Tax=Schaalia canis TaxID=100469 RepID=A0A3P1SGT4_9ACTO|nr:Ig-like domain-containing protein [Schaalia canis]RRC95542.1 fibronectin type III domain-containing protein [Schaalia canis]